MFVVYVETNQGRLYYQTDAFVGRIAQAFQFDSLEFAQWAARKVGGFVKSVADQWLDDGSN